MHARAVLSATAALAVLGLSVAIPPAQAAVSYTFQTIDNPSDPTFNQLLGINNSGVIAGYFGSGVPGHPNQGYTYSSGTFTPENFPGSAQTQVTGINNHGTTVGFYSPTNNGFDANFGFWHLTAGSYTAVFNPSTPSPPTALPTNQLLGINDNGLAVGFYVDANGVSHGYTFNVKSSVFSAPINAFGDSTTATAINNAGDIAGFYTDSSDATHGFYDADGVFTAINAPKAVFTQVLGMNNEGMLVGDSMGSGGHMFGFLTNDTGSSWQFFNFGGLFTTTINGINDNGDIVGFYVNSAGNTIGLLGTPASLRAALATSAPEPATWVMMMVGFAGLGFFGHRAGRQRDRRRVITEA